MAKKKTHKVIPADNYTPPITLHVISDDSYLVYVDYITPADTGIILYRYRYVWSKTKHGTTLGMTKAQIIESLRKGIFDESALIVNETNTIPHADTVPKLPRLF